MQKATGHHVTKAADEQPGSRQCRLPKYRNDFVGSLMLVHGQAST